MPLPLPLPLGCLSCRSCSCSVPVRVEWPTPFACLPPLPTTEGACFCNSTYPYGRIPANIEDPPGDCWALPMLPPWGQQTPIVPRLHTGDGTQQSGAVCPAFANPTPVLCARTAHGRAGQRLIITAVHVQAYLHSLALRCCEPSNPSPQPLPHSCHCLALRHASREARPPHVRALPGGQADGQPPTHLLVPYRLRAWCACSTCCACCACITERTPQVAAPASQPAQASWLAG